MLAPSDLPEPPAGAPPTNLQLLPDASTVSVTKAARILGVHPNTVRSWTQQGRLRCLRINPRGDRRYSVGDLQAFIAAVRVEATATTPRAAAAEPAAAASRRDAELRVLSEVARLTARVADLDVTLHQVAHLLREAFGYRLVAFAQARGGQLVARVADGVPVDRLPPLVLGAGLVGAAVRDDALIFVSDVHDDPRYLEVLPEVVAEIAVPIRTAGEPWGCLLAADVRPDVLASADVALLTAVADQVAVAAENVALVERVQRQLDLAEALRRVSADISSRLDLPVILAELVDQAMGLFGADRGAVFRQAPDGTYHAPVARGLSERFLRHVSTMPRPSLAALALESRETLFSVDYASDPRSAGVRQQVVEEGFDTIAVAPLLADDEALGVLALYHDRRHPWARPELEALRALAAQASIAIVNARTYAQMARWAAQLQSIQQLGTRLNRLTSVRDIGAGIAAELHELIDYHNVRVYRVVGEDCVPVAWRGEIGEYTDEVEEELRLKVGTGITGWVAEHGIAQYLPDASNDPRSRTIAGTDVIDESMLIAPMTFEDRVIGVIVLSKLGLHQFSPDDLRLLEIYASLAAQAMANADATEQLRAQSHALERQLRSQRELVRLAESMFATLDPEAVLGEIAERLGSLVSVDNIRIDHFDRDAGLLVPKVARGIHAAEYLAAPRRGDEGIAGWVVRHGEGQLVRDQLADPRVGHLPELGPEAGSLIVVPLRSRDGIRGVLTLERLGGSVPFGVEEFELVQLFAAQASIAMQNAEEYEEEKRRAETDLLTGLYNHGTFQEALRRATARGERFSVLMLDLDDFKGFNDDHGHPAGDALLQGIARALTAAGREGDTVYRYGGDEFALLLPHADAAGALVVADRVRGAVRELSGRGGAGGWRPVTCSTGVATFPLDGHDARTVLEAADRALYVAKRGGGDRIATAAEAMAVAADFSPTAPTPVDVPSLLEPTGS